MFITWEIVMDNHDSSILFQLMSFITDV